MRFVKDVLKYKGIRRHAVKKTNDAEYYFIQALEFLEGGDHENAVRYLETTWPDVEWRS